jgi:hypothetical protein
LGFALLGYPAEDLVRDFAQTPLTRFCRPGDKSPCPPAPQSICGSPTRPIRPKRPKMQQADHATLLGFPHLVASQALRQHILRAMRSPHMATRITANPPMVFGECPRPPESPGFGRGAKHSRPSRRMLVVPFRVFGVAARPGVLPPKAVLGGLAARSEFLAR